MGGLISTRLLSVLDRTLGALALRHRIIADNIANVDTPGYKRAEVLFSDHLREALNNTGPLRLARTAAGHLGADGDLDAGVAVRRVGWTSLRNDGNNVDIEREMANLAANSIHYNAVARQANDHLDLLEMVISEGRR